MDSKTFILRKIFLEEFYKERVNFNFKKETIRDKSKDYITILLTYETNVFYPETFNLTFVEHIIPFIFYLNNLYGCNLNDDIKILEYETEIFFNDDSYAKHNLFSLFSFDYNNNKFLSCLNREINKYKGYRIRNIPFAPFNFRVELCIAIKNNLHKKPINSIQTFKTGDCVICLTKPPQVLFCNCGHLCVCTECNKMEILETCPICQTENTILRVIE